MVLSMERIMAFVVLAVALFSATLVSVSEGKAFGNNVSSYTLLNCNFYLISCMQIMSRRRDYLFASSHLCTSFVHIPFEKISNLYTNSIYYAQMHYNILGHTHIKIIQ